MKRTARCGSHKRSNKQTGSSIASGQKMAAYSCCHFLAASPASSSNFDTTLNVFSRFSTPWLEACAFEILCTRGAYTLDSIVAFMSELLAAVFVTVLIGISLLPIAICTLWCYCRGPSRTLAQISAVWLAWNTHFVGYATWVWPFFVYQICVGSSWTSTVSNYLMFAVCVGHSLLCVTGLFKHYCYHVKMAWGETQQSIAVGIFYLLVIATSTYEYYNDEENFHIMLLVSVAYSIYTYNTCNRPELTGGRAWSEQFRESLEPLLLLCRSYISLKIVVDGKITGELKQASDGSLPGFFQKGKGCVIGFTPHGMLPVTAGLVVHSPEWKRLFPGSSTHFMTDKFTHLVFGMRDAYQGFLSREVSKASVIQVLQKKDNAILVPGGHHEIFASKSWGKKVTVRRR
jgi:hypothetical protein